MRISEGMKKIAGFATLRTLGHSTDSFSPGRQIDKFTVELFVGVRVSFQMSPSPRRLSFRVVFDVQIATQMEFSVATTLERFNFTKRF